MDSCSLSLQTTLNKFILRNAYFKKLTFAGLTNGSTIIKLVFNT